MFSYFKISLLEVKSAEIVEFVFTLMNSILSELIVDSETGQGYVESSSSPLITVPVAVVTSNEP